MSMSFVELYENEKQTIKIFRCNTIMQYGVLVKNVFSGELLLEMYRFVHVCPRARNGICGKYFTNSENMFVKILKLLAWGSRDILVLKSTCCFCR